MYTHCIIISLVIEIYRIVTVNKSTFSVQLLLMLSAHRYESVQMFTLRQYVIGLSFCLLPSVVVAATGPDGRCACSIAGITVISVRVQRG